MKPRACIETLYSLHQRRKSTAKNALVEVESFAPQETALLREVLRAKTSAERAQPVQQLVARLGSLHKSPRLYGPKYLLDAATATVKVNGTQVMLLRPDRDRRA